MKYAAIINSSYIVPGDERSRTNPGHGYPEHSIETIIIQEFKNEEEILHQYFSVIGWRLSNVTT